MFIAAIVLLSIGSFGTGGAVIMEVIKREPIYAIMMKIFPWFFGAGGILMGIALTRG